MRVNVIHPCTIAGQPRSEGEKNVEVPDREAIALIRNGHLEDANGEFQTGTFDPSASPKTLEAS